MDSPENYRAYVFEKTGIAVPKDDTLMAFHAMLEKFETDHSTSESRITEELRSQVKAFKLDANAVDSSRRKNWSEDTAKFERELLQDLQDMNKANMNRQESTFRKISSDFSKEIKETMSLASRQYSQNVQYFLWFSIADMVLVLFAAYLVLRSTP